MCYKDDSDKGLRGVTAQPASLYKKKGGVIMLWTIAAVLIVLWLLGMITSITIGGFLHVLIVIAVIVIYVRLSRGKKKPQLKLPAAPKNLRVHRSFTERENLLV
jgi:4-hydroxybenzoate polyprenyltransferase